MVRFWALSFLVVCTSLLAQPAVADESSGTGKAQVRPRQSDRPVIYLSVDAATYRSRGRVSFGIAPTLKSKLSAAGYAVTQESDVPRGLTLMVRYREERGRQITLDLYGTDIFCTIMLVDSSENRLLDLAIREHPDYADMVTAPYIEVVDKFQANPYFYFLPDLIRGRTESDLDVTAALIDALERMLYPTSHTVVTSLDTLLSPAETFPNLDDHFSSAASRRTIQELGRLQDSRATDLLLKLTAHPDRAIRVEVIRALEGFPSAAVVTAVSRMAQEDVDATVRDAAKAVLAKLRLP